MNDTYQEQVDALKATLARLTTEIATRDATIAKLIGRVDRLRGRISRACDALTGTTAADANDTSRHGQ